MFIKKKNVIKYSYKGFTGSLDSLPNGVLTELQQLADEGNIICIDDLNGGLYYFTFEDEELSPIGGSGSTSIAVLTGYLTSDGKFYANFSYNEVLGYLNAGVPVFVNIIDNNESHMMYFVTDAKFYGYDYVVGLLSYWLDYTDSEGLTYNVNELIFVSDSADTNLEGLYN